MDGHERRVTCSRRHTYGDCDAPSVGRRKVDEAFVQHFEGLSLDVEATKARLVEAATGRSADARALADEADREEAQAEALTVRADRMLFEGKIADGDYQRLLAMADEARSRRRLAPSSCGAGRPKPTPRPRRSTPTARSRSTWRRCAPRSRPGSAAAGRRRRRSRACAPRSPACSSA